MYLLVKMVVLHYYVSLPEGNFLFQPYFSPKTDKVLTALIALGSVAQAKVSLVVDASGHGIDLGESFEEISVNRKKLEWKRFGEGIPLPSNLKDFGWLCRGWGRYTLPRFLGHWKAKQKKKVGEARGVRSVFLRKPTPFVRNSHCSWWFSPPN